MQHLPELSGAAKMKAEEHFNDTADRYEEQITKIVPHFNLFFRSAVDCILDGSITVLELGSGTGYVTERILTKNPGATITCIDMTPEMLSVARKKPALGGVTFMEGDFRDVWPDERFDVVITTLCLHHLPDTDRAALIRRIHTTLKPEGRFINGDVFKPESEWEETIYRKRWRRSMIEDGLPKTEAEGMLAKREKSYGFLDTFRNYRQKLVDAGFERIFCPYVYDFYGVVIAFW
jgi:tRNA (cmo5U34)-methyltransferase